MTERGFDTGYWTDPFVRKLCPNGKLLFGYLWTNDHCNQAGTYQIDLETIAFETKLSEVALPALIQSLDPKVKWFHNESTIWVKNFIARQAKSPKFLIAAANCLKRLNNNGIAREVVEYNAQHHSISIPYPYSTDSVSIHSTSPSISRSSSISNTNSSKGGSGGDEVLFPLLTDNYRYAFGKMPNSKSTAQLRDLSLELSDSGVSEQQIKEAFREAAGQESTKWTVSYVRAILLAWLGAGKE